MASTGCCQGLVGLKSFSIGSGKAESSASLSSCSSLTRVSGFNSPVRLNPGVRTDRQWQGLRVGVKSWRALPKTQAGIQHKGFDDKWTAQAKQAPAVRKNLGLEIEQVRLPGSRVKLTVTVPMQLCKDTWERTILAICKKQQIKGFRARAKVPDMILMSHVGKKNVLAAILHELLTRTLPNAVLHVEGKVLENTERISPSFEDMMELISPSQTFTYQVLVEVEPEVTWTSERAYAGMHVRVDVPHMSDVQESILEFRSLHKELGTLHDSNKPLELGDVAVIDMTAQIFSAEDGSSIGEVIERDDWKNLQVDTDDVVNTLLPGFAEALVGIQVNDTRRFRSVFPEFWPPELRGVGATFTVECKGVRVWEVPPLEDSLAGHFVDGASTLQEVQEALILKHQEAFELERLDEELFSTIDALNEVSQMDLPQSLLLEFGQKMYLNTLLEYQEHMPDDLTAEEFKALARPDMVQLYLHRQRHEIVAKVKQYIAAEHIFHAENLSYTEEDLDGACETLASKEEVVDEDKADLRERATKLLQRETALRWLLQNTQFDYKPIATVLEIDPSA